MFWVNVFFKITLIIYFVSSGFYIKREFFSDPKTKNHWTANLLYVGIGTHTLSLLALILATNYLPIKNLFETILLLTWTVIIIYMLIEYLYKFRVLGAFILPVNSLLLLYAIFLPNDLNNLPESMQSIWLSIHTSTIFVGYGVFTLAFCVSIAYLIQEKQLQDKKLSIFYHRLPPLEKLEQLNLQLVAVGFPLLTIGIITGSLWAKEVWGMYWNWNIKQIWVSIIWLIYALYLHNRISGKWRGKKSVYITIVGFLAILFTYLGLSFLPVEFHNFN
ncbi:c-type cytochrome biogenesis protein CcsB [Sporohalobacter salinus]|uniref:c-type cytochrome biogenesis protein CcsB n=1 Tax=Sporohalobacter salinus TaxID=1494606 RepID=UPI0019615649|nr:c-type cytochrome biogenesis protein CcsB [Sporohalobacter salinus]MBM7623078.1 cytochrome c-type biogenesis protein CcsB [Sporohalobacter salinus]